MRCSGGLSKQFDKIVALFLCLEAQNSEFLVVASMQPVAFGHAAAYVAFEKKALKASVIKVQVCSAAQCYTLCVLLVTWMERTAIT